MARSKPLTKAQTLEVDRRVRAAIADIEMFSLPSTIETDSTIGKGKSWNSMYRDRYDYDRQEIILDAIKSWRLNPLARRITNLYKIYLLDGISFDCKHEGTKKFLEEFWNHPLNIIPEKLDQAANELFLTGNLFPLITVDTAGMSYLRIYPSDQIAEIITADNDIAQERKYTTRPTNVSDEPNTFHHPSTNARRKTFMLHFAINRLAGTTWGEGEIWPDLPWLSRYASFLISRVMINEYRQRYLYDVTITGKTDTQIATRKAELRKNPPSTGDTNVHGDNETWQIIAPKLESAEAERDGLMIKKMVAVNHAPMHYLAEPESSTRTTADAAGTPAFKQFEAQQKFFLGMVKQILTIAVQRRAAIASDDVDPTAEIFVTCADATERDNAALALATGQIVAALEKLFDRDLITEDEFMRLFYRFSGETLPPNFKAPKGKKKSLSKPNASAPGGIKTDTESGETKLPENAE